MTKPKEAVGTEAFTLGNQGGEAWSSSSPGGAREDVSLRTRRGGMALRVDTGKEGCGIHKKEEEEEE